MSNNNIEVSIIIPCRNEEKFIGRCLESIVSQDFPKDKLEVLVVDGMSKDKTKDIIREFSNKYPFIRLIENPNYYAPFGLNLGIKNTKGEIIMRMDAHAAYNTRDVKDQTPVRTGSDIIMGMGAHATYEKSYISKCVDYLKKYNVDNVGGVMRTLPRDNTHIGNAIAIALSHPFGAGNSYFRIGSKEPRLVDTVFGGCYKREVFEKIGHFNEKLIRSQDLELNLRLKGAGGKTLLVPEIVSYYYARSDLKVFTLKNFEDGVWAIYPMKITKKFFGIRHYIPLGFVLALVGSGILGIFLKPFLWLSLATFFLYFFVSVYFSFNIAIERRDIRYFFLMPFVFFIRHFVYGLGSILGLIKIVFNL